MDRLGNGFRAAVVVGSDDALLDSRETRDRVVRCVPNASVVWIDNAGHVLPPQTATVSGFLSGLQSVPGETPAARSLTTRANGSTERCALRSYEKTAAKVTTS